jgi:hypothetical protein
VGGAFVEDWSQYLDAEAVAFASKALDDASVAFKWHKVCVPNLHWIPQALGEHV